MQLTLSPQNELNLQWKLISVPFFYFSKQLISQPFFKKWKVYVMFKLNSFIWINQDSFNFEARKVVVIAVRWHILADEFSHVFSATWTVSIVDVNTRVFFEFAHYRIPLLYEMSEENAEQKQAQPERQSVDARYIPNAWLVGSMIDLFSILRHALIVIFEFKVRPCEAYKDEHSECKSIKGRFHQYFIHGDTIDCTQWETDYENCMKYCLRQDMAALV